MATMGHLIGSKQTIEVSSHAYLGSLEIRACVSDLLGCRSMPGFLLQGESKGMGVLSGIDVTGETVGEPHKLYQDLSSWAGLSSPFFA